MPATLGSLVEGILDHLYGHSAQQDAVTSLSGALDATATSFTVDDADVLSAGLIEIDSEIMRVKSVDLSSNLVTLTPTGRGQRGSTASTHADGAEVRVAPIMPYASVVREVNAELSALYPRIVNVDSTDLTASATTYAYDLPAEATMVLDVRFKPTGQDEWERVRKWEIEHTPDGVPQLFAWTSGTSGTIRVIYGKAFGSLSSLTDTLAAAGVPESCEDVVRMGVELRLLPSMDIARLSVISVPSADANDKPPQPGTGILVAREIKQQYQARLLQEIGSFRLRYPARVHLTR